MKALIYFIGTVALVVGLSLVMAFPTKWLMNGIFSPDILQVVFGAVQLSLWKAWGINVLSSVLFKTSVVSK